MQRKFPIPLSNYFSIFIIAVIQIVSCKKENQQANYPPVAKAGADQIIGVPNNGIFLDGSGSFDSDGPIVSYFWRKVSGPTAFNILRTDSVKAILINSCRGNTNLN